MIQVAQGILSNHDNPYRNVIVGFSGNTVSNYGWWETLPEVVINSENVDGYLNVVQAAARDIGRDDYARWRADCYSNLVVGQLLVGSAAPFVVAGAVEAAPYLLTSYLSNPAGWNMAAGEVLLGAHGYDGGVPGAGSVENIAAKTSSRAFFSGAGTEARALNEGFTTLSQTRAGRNLMKMTEGMPYYPAMNGQPASQAYLWWSRLSENTSHHPQTKVYF